MIRSSAFLFCWAFSYDRCFFSLGHKQRLFFWVRSCWLFWERLKDWMVGRGLGIRGWNSRRASINHFFAKKTFLFSPLGKWLKWSNLTIIFFSWVVQVKIVRVRCRWLPQTSETEFSCFSFRRSWPMRPGVMGSDGGVHRKHTENLYQDSHCLGNSWTWILYTQRVMIWGNKSWSVSLYCIWFSGQNGLKHLNSWRVT